MPFLPADSRTAFSWMEVGVGVCQAREYQTDLTHLARDRWYPCWNQDSRAESDTICALLNNHTGWNKKWWSFFMPSISVELPILVLCVSSCHAAPRYWIMQLFCPVQMSECRKTLSHRGRASQKKSGVG